MLSYRACGTSTATRDGHNVRYAINVCRSIQQHRSSTDIASRRIAYGPNKFAVVYDKATLLRDRSTKAEELIDPSQSSVLLTGLPLPC